MDMGGEIPVWTYSYDGISLQNQRAVNMDSLLLKTRMIQGRNFCIAVVCDGVGSMQDGQFAAVTAVTLLNHWFSQIEDDCVCGPCLREQVLKVNRAIYEEAQNQAAICEYRLEHGIENYIDEDGMTGSEYWNSFLQESMMITVVSVIMIVLAGGCVANEFANGTVKFLLVNPVTRRKIIIRIKTNSHTYSNSKV